MYVETGRFSHEIWAEDSVEVKKDLRRQYDEVMNIGARKLDQCQTDLERARFTKHIYGSWDTVDSIEDAIRDLDDDRKAVVYFLFQQVIGETSFISGTEIEQRTRGSTGGVSAKEHDAVDKAIDQELARCGPAGPVHLGRVADDLTKHHGIRREYRALKRRLEARGVQLPTVYKLSAGQKTTSSE